MAHAPVKLYCDSEMEDAVVEWMAKEVAIRATPKGSRKDKAHDSTEWDPRRCDEHSNDPE